MFDTLAPYLARFGDLFSLSTPKMLVGFIVILSVIVFVHEYGHFIVGRWCGIAAEEFSIGFGREIVGWTDRHGTRWKICWLPLGGYVRFAGDDNASSMPSGAVADEEEGPIGLLALPPGRRILVAAAGPVANFLFAIVIFSVFLAMNGKMVLEPRIDGVAPESRAEAAGFKVGDLVLAVNGHDIEDFSEITQQVVINAEQSMRFKVRRGSETVDITATPKLSKISSPIGYVDGGVLGLVVQRDKPGREYQVPLSLPGAIAESGRMTWSIIDQSLATLGKIVTGKVSFSQLSSPIDIARMTGKIVDNGHASRLNVLLDLVKFAAFISVSIGMVNLLPIPVLDGGHILFALLEMIIRRPLNERIQEVAFKLGLAMILAVFLIVSWGSILRIFTS